MRWLAVAAAVIAAVVDVLYQALVRAQPGPGDGFFLRVPFVTAFIALLAVAAALASAAAAAKVRPALLALSAIGLLAIGFIAIFSIGLPLLVAGGLALVAAINSLARSPRPAGALQGLAGGLVALIIFVGGIDLTEPAITCPSTGVMSGSGEGFIFSGAYHYSCINGKLTVQEGFCNRSPSVDSSGKVTAVSGC